MSYELCELPEKFCSLCGKRLRRKLESYAYQVGICSPCTKSKPECAELKRQINALRNRKYYDTHTESEIKRVADYKKRKAGNNY
jgi:hypothetical protein